MERFLEEFGHRGVYEVDIANPRWIEDPTFVLEQIRLLLDSDLPVDFREEGRRRRREAEQAIARRARLLRPFIRWITGRARRGAALREASKSALVARLEPLRAIFMEVGRRMQAAGALDDPGDIFFLTRPEIDAYMRSWWNGQGARNLVEDRKAQREAWFLEEPPDVVFVDADGAMETADIAAVSPTESAAAASSGAAAASPSVVTGSRLGERLVGSGVAAGTASGRVRLLRHPNEGHRLGHGEILVAPSTVDGDAGVVIRTGD